MYLLCGLSCPSVTHQEYLAFLAIFIAAGLSYLEATGYLVLRPGSYVFAIAPSPSSSVKQAIYTTPRVHLR